MAGFVDDGAAIDRTAALRASARSYPGSARSPVLARPLTLTTIQVRRLEPTRRPEAGGSIVHVRAG